MIQIHGQDLVVGGGVDLEATQHTAIGLHSALLIVYHELHAAEKSL